MFALPRNVIKSGVVVLDDGDLRPSPVAETRYVEPGYDPEIVPEIEAWFARDYSINRRISPSMNTTWKPRKADIAPRPGVLAPRRWCGDAPPDKTSREQWKWTQ